MKRFSGLKQVKKFGFGWLVVLLTSQAFAQSGARVVAAPIDPSASEPKEMVPVPEEHRRNALEEGGELAIGTQALPDLQKEVVAPKVLPKKVSPANPTDSKKALNLPGLPQDAVEAQTAAQRAVVEKAPQVSYVEELESLRFPREEYSAESAFLKEGGLKSKTLK